MKRPLFIEPGLGLLVLSRVLKWFNASNSEFVNLSLCQTILQNECHHLIPRDISTGASSFFFLIRSTEYINTYEPPSSFGLIQMQTSDDLHSLNYNYSVLTKLDFGT